MTQVPPKKCTETNRTLETFYFLCRRHLACWQGDAISADLRVISFKGLVLLIIFLPFIKLNFSTANCIILAYMPVEEAEKKKKKKKIIA